MNGPRVTSKERQHDICLAWSTADFCYYLGPEFLPDISTDYGSRCGIEARDVV